MKLRPSHLEELRASGIADDVINANFESIEGQWAVDLMLPYKQWQRRNDGRLTDSDLRIYNVFADGGWTCSGLNPITLEDSQWGCFKPDRPRVTKDGKVIKYEHPHKVSTEVFCLRPTRHIWRKVSKRSGVECPDLQAIPNEDISREFWQWVKDNPTVPIPITEGAKKAASLLSAGYVAIGLPGIYNGYRTPKDEFGNRTSEPSHLIPELEALCQKGREFIFCFDNDPKTKTQDNVRKAIANTGHLIKAKGCKVSVMTWSLPFKGIDDLIVACGETSLDRIYDNRISLDAYQLEKHWDLSEYVRLRVNTPNLLDAVKDIPDAQLIGIKSPKGSYKTEWLAQMIHAFLMSGGKVVVPVHREQLAKELAQRLEIDYRTEPSETGKIFGYSLCVDSLHPHANPGFHAESWEGCWVIIDETDQVAWHALNSSTCTSNRANILESLSELLNVADKIFLTSADLNKACINWVNEMLENPCIPFVILNEYQRESIRDCYSYDTPEDCYTILTQNLDAGQKALIHTGGQQDKSKWGTRNLERMLKARYPNKKILRIDRKSVAQPGHPAYGCIGNLNAVLANYDIVIMSPVVETGVSITCPGFDAVYGFASGSQTVDAVGQSLERYRLPVPRHIYVIKNAGQNLIGNGSTNPLSLIRGQKQLSEIQKALLDADQYSSFELGIKSIHLDTWAIFAAHHNIGFQHYRDSLYQLLKQNSFRIQEVTLDDEMQNLAFQIKERASNSAELGHKQHCQAIANAEIITDDREYKELKNKRAKTEEEQLQEKASMISRRYATDSLTPELVDQDSQRGWHPAIQLHYYLTLGREYLSDRDKRRVKRLTENSNKVFEPDLNRACLGVKIDTLEKTGFLALLDGDRTFCQDDPDLIQWHRRVCGWAPQIREILGITVKSDPKAKNNGPINVLRRFMSKVGLELEWVDRKTTGSKAGIYKLKSINPDGRFKIFDRWLERDKNRRCVELTLQKTKEAETLDVDWFDALINGCVEGISNISPLLSHTPPTPISPSDQQGRVNGTLEPLPDFSPSEVGTTSKRPSSFKVGDWVKAFFWDRTTHLEQIIEGAITAIHQNYWVVVGNRYVPYTEVEHLSLSP